MKKPVAIHQNKRPIRRHFLAEWLEDRGMTPMDLLDALNEAEMARQPIDKSQVYRWMRGQLPQPDMQVRIAGVLEIEPEALLRHPNDDWIARKLQGRPKEEVKRIKQMIDLAFPDKTGTDN